MIPIQNLYMKNKSWLYSIFSKPDRLKIELYTINFCNIHRYDKKIKLDLFINLLLLKIGSQIIRKPISNYINDRIYNYNNYAVFKSV